MSIRFRTKKGEYGTHLPVLRSLNQIMEVKTIIEMGMGIYSTPTFLDRKYFPSLESLSSFETNSEWYTYIKKRCGSDPRSQYILVPSAGDICKHVSDKHDLCFVDGMEEDRHLIMDSMRDLARIYVMHDVESYPKELLRDFKYLYIYKPPYHIAETGVGSNEIEVEQLKSLTVWKSDYLKWKL